jgi:4-aminobutyrate aminotransferase-like enzyme
MDALPANGVSTFGGNPISTAAANATLDYVLDHDLQANAARLGPLVLERLQPLEQLPTVSAVRGRGLMFAIDMADPATGAPSAELAVAVLEETRKRGLLIGKGGLHGQTLRMAPPLTLTEEEAEEGAAILVDAVTAVNDAVA